MTSQMLVTLTLSFCLLLNSGSSPTQGPPEQKQVGAAFVPLCQILREPAKYNSKEVVTVGVAGNSFHQTDFFEPECTLPKHGGSLLLRFEDSYKLGQTADKKYFNLLKKEGTILVKFRGRFVSTGGPFGPEGSPYELLVTEILDLQKLSPEYRQQYSIGTGHTNPNN
jgi:hypothetical protein